jgi:uncharacterized protein (UPF0333 family)
MKNRKFKIRLTSRQGQVMIEYVLMVSMVVIVMIIAAVRFIQPAVNSLYRESGSVISNAADNLAAEANQW